MSARPFRMLVRRVGGVTAVAFAVAAGTLALPAAAASHPAAAAATPTISVSPASGGPGATVRLKASGYNATNPIYVYVGSAYMCGLTPNASGVVAATTCTVPAVPVGAATLSGQQNSNTVTATTPFTVTPRISYLSSGAVSPGAVITVNVGGLGGSKAVTAKVDSTVATTSPPAVSTDANGSVGSLQVTIPAGTSAGHHTLSIGDSSGNAATDPITVFAPTLSVTPSSTSPGSTLLVTGGGWRPNTNIYLYANTTYFCSVAVSSAGTLNGTCGAPNVPFGAVVFSGQENGTAISATQSGSQTPGLTYLSSDVASRGGTFYVNVGGLSASSPVAATISGNSGNLTTSPVSVSSDTNGTVNGLYVTMPTSTSFTAGIHTLSITDGSGHAATAKIDIYTPTFAIASSGSAGRPITVSGSKFIAGQAVYLYAGGGANGVGGTYFGGLTADSTGSISGSVTLPQLPSQSLTVYATQGSSNPVAVSKPFTLKPGLTYQNAQFIGPGSTLSVNVAGLNPSVGFTVTVGKTTATTTGPITTDTNGTLNSLGIVIPASAKAGSTAITVKDKGSSAQSVKITVLVYAPTVSLSPSSGTPNSPVHITGSGFRPEDSVYLQGVNGAYTVGLCSLNADVSGGIDGYCGTPAAPRGSYTVTAEQDGTAITATPSSPLTIVPGFYSVGTTVSGGGSDQFYVQGLAPTSAVTVKIDTTTVAVTSGNTTTDGSGNAGYLTVTLPTTLAAGNHTLTVTDAGGGVATATLTAITPTLTTSDTSVAAGSSFALNGTGFDGGQSVAIYLDGTYFCGLGADPSGGLTGSCTVPTATAAGSHVLSVQQDNGAVRVNSTLTTT